MVEHDYDTFGRAAELAYYFFLAVFPGLIFLLNIFGLVAGANPELRNTLFFARGSGLAGFGIPPATDHSRGIWPQVAFEWLQRDAQLSESA